MPFQVTYSQKAIPSGIIQSVDAGEDANAVCDLSFTLTATVIGDITGHTFLWEQVQGTAVTFTTPVDQFTVSYNQSTFDDKVFRFWVDKGTASQRFDDINIFGSPTSTVNDFVTSIGTNIVNNTTTSRTGDQVALRFYTPYPLAPHDGVSAAHTYTTATLLWFAPETNNEILGYLVKERNDVTGIWNDIASLPASAQLFHATVIGNTYQIVTLFKYDNSFVGQVGSNIVWINGIMDSPKIAGVDSIVPYIYPSKTVIETNYAVESLVILVCDPGYDSLILAPTISNNSYVEVYDSIQLKLVGKDAPYDSMFSAVSLPTNVDVSLYDVTVLTGTQVGGS